MAHKAPHDPHNNLPVRTLTSGGKVACCLLAICLSAICAIAIAITIPKYKPTFFGSCFEGSCGYMAMLVFAPAVTLVIAPFFYWILKRTGPLTQLILWLILASSIGHYILSTLPWLTATGVILWLILRLIRRHSAQGGTIRQLF